MLEDVLKPDFKERLIDIYKRGQYLLSSDLVQGENFRFQKALENFYDLEIGVDSSSCWPVNGTVINKYGLQRKREDTARLKEVPIQLIKTLDDFGDNHLSPDLKNELSYQNVRQSFRPDMSYIDRKFSTLFNISSVGLMTGMGGILYSVANQNLNHLFWAVPLMISSYVGITIIAMSPVKGIVKEISERKDILRMPEEKQRRMLAFWKLHDSAVEADALLKEYKQYFLDNTNLPSSSQ